VAIRATHLAFVDLLEDRGPTVKAQHPADAGTLFAADVIKLKTAQITFAAIHTGVFFEIAHQPLSVFLEKARRPPSRLLKVVRSVCLIVPAKLLLGAFAAVRLTLTGPQVFEIEVRYRLLTATPGARLGIQMPGPFWPNAAIGADRQWG